MSNEQNHCHKYFIPFVLLAKFLICVFCAYAHFWLASNSSRSNTYTVPLQSIHICMDTYWNILEIVCGFLVFVHMFERPHTTVISSSIRSWQNKRLQTNPNRALLFHGLKMVKCKLMKFLHLKEFNRMSRLCGFAKCACINAMCTRQYGR